MKMCNCSFCKKSFSFWSSVLSNRYNLANYDYLLHQMNAYLSDYIFTKDKEHLHQGKLMPHSSVYKAMALKCKNALENLKKILKLWKEPEKSGEEKQLEFLFKGEKHEKMEI